MTLETQRMQYSDITVSLLYFSATQAKVIILKITNFKCICSAPIWYNSFSKIDVICKMMQEQKFNVHNTLKSIKGINNFFEDTAIMFRENTFILKKLQSLLALTNSLI